MFNRKVRIFSARALVAGAFLMALLVPGAVAQATGKRLNNLVVSLVEKRGASTAAPVTFKNPREGWVYIGCTGLDPSVAWVLRGQGSEEVMLPVQTSPRGVLECMRLLPQGSYTLAFRAEPAVKIGTLSVRAMPETHFVRFPGEPHFPELGTFSWDWLKAHVLSSVNTVAGLPSAESEAAIAEWTGLGRKFIAYGGLPHDVGLTAEQALKVWVENPGFQDPRLSGMIADEFQGRQNPSYPAWIEGMRQLGIQMKGTGKDFYGYCGGPGMYSRPETRELVKTVFDAGFFMAWERYHHEMPTLAGAKEFMDSLLGEEMAKWQAKFPGCQEQMVLVLGIFATGPELDVQPLVNYKVWMDMQMQYLATHPAFEGLYGVHWWYSGGANEELLRWESALYRHYCIEGRRDLLSKTLGWTYELPHIQNPDFFDGVRGWSTAPAATDSLNTGYLERYAQVQGRYWHRGNTPDDPAGNTYLWLKRNAEKPNKVSQEIKHLVHGRLYTVQMITADYQDIVGGVTAEKRHAVSLEVDGAEIVPGGSFHSVPVPGYTKQDQLPFPDGPAWFNHHRVLFRATSEKARLVISDWAAPDAPGGDPGQELMVNYLQVQPYFEE